MWQDRGDSWESIHLFCRHTEDILRKVGNPLAMDPISVLWTKQNKNLLLPTVESQVWNNTRSKQGQNFPFWVEYPFNVPEQNLFCSVLPGFDKTLSFRYLRFFPDGQVMMLTTPEDPLITVPRLRSKNSRYVSRELG